MHCTVYGGNQLSPRVAPSFVPSKFTCENWKQFVLHSFFGYAHFSVSLNLRLELAVFAIEPLLWVNGLSDKPT